MGLELELLGKAAWPAMEEGYAAKTPAHILVLAQQHVKGTYMASCYHNISACLNMITCILQARSKSRSLESWPLEFPSSRLRGATFLGWDGAFNPSPFKHQGLLLQFQWAKPFIQALLTGWRFVVKLTGIYVVCYYINLDLHYSYLTTEGVKPIDAQDGFFLCGPTGCLFLVYKCAPNELQKKIRHWKGIGNIKMLWNRSPQNI